MKNWIMVHRVYRVCWVYWVGCVSYLLLCSGALARPTVVVGDTNALAPLGYTSYFEDQPIFFFTSQLSSSQIRNLLEKTKSMIIVNHQLKNYGEEVQNFLNDPTIDLAYLFFKEKSEDDLMKRSFYLPRESQYRMKVRVILDLAQVKKDIGLDLDMGLAQELKKLSFIAKNVEYNYVISDEGALSVNAYFDRELSKETEDEYVKVTIPHLYLNIDKYPFLELIFRVQDPKVQQIDGELGIDLTGDGRVDETISLSKEKKVILENWRWFPRIHHLNQKMDLYHTDLPEEWPTTYTSEFSSRDRFTVYKNGIPMQTSWHRWWYEEEWVEMDGGYKRVIIAVPQGESPEDSVYKAKFRYLPSVKKSKIYPGFDRLNIKITERLEETFGQQANPRLINLHLYLKKAKDIDSSGPDKRRVYSFEIKETNVYGYPTPKEMLSSEWFRKMPLFRIARKVYSGEDIDKITVESDYLWCEIENPKLRKGNYEFFPMLSETLKVDLAVIEPVSRPQLLEGQEKEVQVEFQKINSARYKVQVKTKKSFWLIFRESFHPGWKAYMRRSSGIRSQGGNFEWSAVLSALRDWGKRVELREHYPVNGYANAWWVAVTEFETKTKEQKSNPQEFEILIEYTPQRWLEIKITVSLIILVGGVGYLVFRSRQRRNRSLVDDSDKEGGD